MDLGHVTGLGRLPIRYGHKGQVVIGQSFAFLLTLP